MNLSPKKLLSEIIPLLCSVGLIRFYVEADLETNVIFFLTIGLLIIAGVAIYLTRKSPAKIEWVGFVAILLVATFCFFVKHNSFARLEVI